MSSIVSHVLQRIAETPLKSDPFCHFFIEQIFPSDFYRELTENLPDPLLYDYSGANDRRWQMMLSHDTLDRMPPSQKLVWGKFYESICGAPFLIAILEKFQPHLKGQCQERIDKEGLFSVAHLIQDTANYSIEPHTDHPEKVASLLFYFPTFPDQAHLGTALYRPKNRELKCSGLYRYPFEDFEMAWKPPFVPNSVFGFFKTDDSFHGVEPTGKNQKDRNLIAYTIWKKNPLI